MTALSIGQGDCESGRARRRFDPEILVLVAIATMMSILDQGSRNLPVGPNAGVV